MISTSKDTHTPSYSPFNLELQETYWRWRDAKLTNYPEDITGIALEIKNPDKLTSQEKSELLLCCHQTNMVIYNTLHSFEKPDLSRMCQQLGMNRLDNNLCADEDGVSSIQVTPKGKNREYIPYTNRPINWHTDGYYNVDAHRIRGMVLHCVRPAAEGGDNAFIDHERIYIALRDQNPDFIRALMQPDAMTIPANVQDGLEIRAEQSGPVFSVDPLTTELHMRYTARTRSIYWKDDDITRQAVEALEALLSSNAPYIYRVRLEAGQGIISNNVLHRRDGFEDGSELAQQRLVYRARYYDRVGSKER